MGASSRPSRVRGSAARLRRPLTDYHWAARLALVRGVGMLANGGIAAAAVGHPTKDAPVLGSTPAHWRPS